MCIIKIINIMEHNKNTLQLYFRFTKLVELKSAKLEQLILRYFNCAEVVLKSKERYTEVYLIVLKFTVKVYFRYTIISCI